MKRAADRRGKDGADRFEAEALAFHDKLRDGFLTLAANEPGRCVLIDATLPKEEVSEQIWRVVTKRLDPATAPIAFEDVAS
jgi:dTMP kinase